MQDTGAGAAVPGCTAVEAKQPCLSCGTMLTPCHTTLLLDSAEPKAKPRPSHYQDRTRLNTERSVGGRAGSGQSDLLQSESSVSVTTAQSVGTAPGAERGLAARAAHCPEPRGSNRRKGREHFQNPPTPILLNR